MSTNTSTGSSPTSKANAPKGLSEDIVRFISAKKSEPDWMLEWRLNAYRALAGHERADLGATFTIRTIDFEDPYYYSAPKSTEGPKSLDEVDPELLKTYEKLGIPLDGAEDAGGRRDRRCFRQRSRSLRRSRRKLAEAGVIFCSISEALREHPDLVRKYLGSVVPQSDNFYATLNSAVFSGRLVRLRPAERALPDGIVDLLPHQRARDRSVRAHAHHRRQRLLRQLPRRLHRAACATRTSCTPPSSSSLPSMTPRSSIRPCRTGIRATRMARAASTIS